MKLIKRETDYAIRALLYMADREGKIISVSDLTKNLKVPRPFLRKILQVLNTKKIIKSYKGKGGGFEMSVPLKKIFLMDLIKIFQHSFSLDGCLVNKEVCNNIKTCNLRKKINFIEEQIKKEFQATTLETLK